MDDLSNQLFEFCLADWIEACIKLIVFTMAYGTVLRQGLCSEIVLIIGANVLT